MKLKPQNHPGNIGAWLDAICSEIEKIKGGDWFGEPKVNLGNIMDKIPNPDLSNLTPDSVVTKKAIVKARGYAEMFDWTDGNTSSEDRIGYFVTVATNKIKKSENGYDYILGVTANSGVVCADTDFNAETSKATPVVLTGTVVVIDDKTCVVDGYCMPKEGGIATKSEGIGYKVLERVDDTHIKIMLK